MTRPNVKTSALYSKMQKGLDSVSGQLLQVVVISQYYIYSFSALAQNHSMKTYEHKTSRDSCKDQRRLYHADADTSALYSFTLKPCAWNRYRWWTRLNSGNAWNEAPLRVHEDCMIHG